MLISDRQKSALTLLIKMAFSRVNETSLADLVGAPIVIKMSEISLCPVSRMTEEFALLFPEEIISVHQSFTGYMSGDALLIFDYCNALRLINLIDKNHELPRNYIDTTARDMLIEIGNILLNNYLGILTNWLQIQMSFTVPSLQVNLLSELINSLIVGKNELRYCLVTPATFYLDDQVINANLNLVSGVVSLHILIKAIEIWADLTNVSSAKMNQEFRFD